jgi:hypothetical protein
MSGLSAEVAGRSGGRIEIRKDCQEMCCTCTDLVSALQWFLLAALKINSIASSDSRKTLLSPTSTN